MINIIEHKTQTSKLLNNKGKPVLNMITPFNIAKDQPKWHLKSSQILKANSIEESMRQKAQEEQKMENLIREEEV